jgi:hypothetical protein
MKLRIFRTRTRHAKPNCRTVGCVASAGKEAARESSRELASSYYSQYLGLRTRSMSQGTKEQGMNFEFDEDVSQQRVAQLMQLVRYSARQHVLEHDANLLLLLKCLYCK